MIETEVWTSFGSRFIKVTKINKMLSESLTNGMKKREIFTSTSLSYKLKKSKTKTNMKSKERIEK